MGVVIEANELGLRIPEELSVIGFDNVEFARACVPRLSIVSQPTKEIARKVSETLLRRLDAENQQMGKVMIRLETSFSEGKSVKRRPV